MIVKEFDKIKKLCFKIKNIINNDKSLHTSFNFKFDNNTKDIIVFDCKAQNEQELLDFLKCEKKKLADFLEQKRTEKTFINLKIKEEREKKIEERKKQRKLEKEERLKNLFKNFYGGSLFEILTTMKEIISKNKQFDFFKDKLTTKIRRSVNNNNLYLLQEVGSFKTNDVLNFQDMLAEAIGSMCGDTYQWEEIEKEQIEAIIKIAGARIGEEHCITVTDVIGDFNEITVFKTFKRIK